MLCPLLVYSRCSNNVSLYLVPVSSLLISKPFLCHLFPLTHTFFSILVQFLPVFLCFRKTWLKIHYLYLFLLAILMYFPVNIINYYFLFTATYPTLQMYKATPGHFAIVRPVGAHVFTNKSLFILLIISPHQSSRSGIIMVNILGGIRKLVSH